MLWSQTAPSIDEDGKVLPTGLELGASPINASPDELLSSFLILSDHNRSPIDVNIERIEKRQRMANGAMRSFFIADKLSINVSWSMLPSRSFLVSPGFDAITGKPQTGILTPDDIQRPYTDDGTYYADRSLQYTADGGAGGVELLSWYKQNTGPFWVMLSYDNYSEFPQNSQQRIRLSEYAEARFMFISSFNYSVIKRGGTKFDLWDISVTLEEA